MRDILLPSNGKQRYLVFEANVRQHATVLAEELTARVDRVSPNHCLTHTHLAFCFSLFLNGNHYYCILCTCASPRDQVKEVTCGRALLRLTQ